MPFKDNNYQDRKKLVDGYENKIICFLDILGMSNFVEKAENDEKICEIYRMINNYIKNVLPIRFFSESYCADKVTFSSLSDSVIISFPLSEIALLLPYTVMFASLFQYLMLCQGLSVRGFITLGKIYHNKNEPVIFGKGLVKAYQYEKKYIISPRVVIDDKLIAKFDKYTKNDVETHINKLKNKQYISDAHIDSFISTYEHAIPAVAKNIQVFSEFFLYTMQGILRMAITDDTMHNEIYKNRPEYLYKEQKKVTIIFNENRKNFTKELKKRGDFKFGRTDVDKVIESNILKFSTGKQEDETIKFKWQYLKAQYDIFLESHGQATG